jgi:mono/diheme cytochrome c family protein
MKPVKVGDKEVYPFEDSPVNTGRLTGTTNFIELNPFPVTAEFLARGQRQFNIHCAACHTQTGDGNSVARKIVALPTIANLHDKRIVELPDGDVFNTVSNGKNTMPAYGPNVEAADRWAIVAYLRALQLSRLGSLDDVPESARGTLKK